MKCAETNFVTAANVRAAYADKLFHPSSIATAINDRAKQGHRHYRVVQELPFDLSDTDAATALERWLDIEQFHYMWRPAYIEQDALRPSIVTEYLELTITW